MIINGWLTRWMARRLRCWSLERTWLRKPDVYIGGRENPYLVRWYVIPRNRWLNVYLHEFMRSDDDRALHDHPWWSVSLSLNRGVREVYRGWDGKERERDVPPGSLVFRRARFAHRLIVPQPFARTIFITGPRLRTWGFLCPQGWRPWREFVDGQGCD